MDAHAIAWAHYSFKVAWVICRYPENVDEVIGPRFLIEEVNLYSINQESSYEILQEREIMVDLIIKIIGGVIYLFIVAGIGYFGIFSMQYDMDMIGAICLTMALGGLIAPIIAYNEKQQEKRMAVLRKIYGIPERIDNDFGKAWNRELQKVLVRAIDTSTDPEKLKDLEQCSRVVSKMNKGRESYTDLGPFYKINNAFRLTGCHFTITDAQGNKITQIV